MTNQFGDDLLGCVCAAKQATQTGRDTLQRLPSGTIKIGCKFAQLRDEVSVIDVTSGSNPNWLVQAARMEHPTDALNYLHNVGVRPSDVISYMAIDDKFAHALEPFLGGAFPVLNDGRDIDSIKPCSMCGLTGSYNDKGVRSPFVECEGQGCCSDPNDCHAHCAFGHCAPTDDDHWRCGDCGGSHLPAAQVRAARSAPISRNCLFRSSASEPSSSSRLIRTASNIFGIVAWPSIPGEDDAPNWVDINYIMEAAEVRRQHVQRGNIRPLVSHPTTMLVPQRFHE